MELPVHQTLVRRDPLTGKVAVGFGQFHSDPLPFDSVRGDCRRSRPSSAASARQPEPRLADQVDDFVIGQEITRIEVNGSYLHIRA